MTTLKLYVTTGIANVSIASNLLLVFSSDCRTLLTRM